MKLMFRLQMIRKLGSAEIVFVRNCRKEIALFDKWAQEAKAGQVFDVSRLHAPHIELTA